MMDYYSILGVNQDATEAEIKSAYKKLTIKFHPDKNDGDKFFAERFKDIQKAYSVLSDINKRQTYDLQFSNLNGQSNRQTSRTFEEELKKKEEELKKKYEADLKKKEEEIKRKYQTPEQRAAEEAEKKRKEEEEKARIERQNVLNEREGLYRTLSTRENELKTLVQKVSSTESEITRLRKSIDTLNAKLNHETKKQPRNIVQKCPYCGRENEVELDICACGYYFNYEMYKKDHPDG